MKIILFNINGLKTSISYIDKLLTSSERPDILGLNEIKCTENTLNKLKLQLSGRVSNDYHIIWNPAEKLSWHGTAIFISRKYNYKLLNLTLPNKKTDEETIKAHTKEGRLIAVEIDGTCFVLTYVPNSGVNPKCWLRRLDYRVNSWDSDMFEYINEMYEKYDGKVIWMGDLNVARTSLDIKKEVRQAGYTKEERESFEKFLESGRFIDVWRELHPDIRGYTYKGGWRLDYFIISDKLYEKVKDNETIKCEIKCEIGEDPEEVSDHLPLILDIIQ